MQLLTWPYGLHLPVPQHGSGIPGRVCSHEGKTWDFKTVPWAVGTDFTAPTCATCHISLVVSDEGEVLSERTHQMNDRLSWRIFGLVHDHAHPKSPDTTLIRTKAGRPLPTEFTSEPVAKYLIDEKKQKKGRETVRKVCRVCHGQKWVEQWLFFANSTRFSSAMPGADYGSFADGRWYMSKNIQEMVEWLGFKLKKG